MKKRIYMILLSLALLALGLSLGYFYRDRSANFERYDRYLQELTTNIFLMDAFRHKEYGILETILAGKLESGTSWMVLLYDENKFNDRGEYLRCTITRKVRVLFEDKKIFASPERLEYLDYDQVKTYLDTNCAGKPSHDNWNSVNPGQ